ncbi:MAG: DEAD/DEAH box helicase [Candidatus Lokiarchaeota archaeon]|nr:DEAD/DEAH box helicase [Candidatus Lokiarchaeota archaeon]
MNFDNLELTFIPSKYWNKQESGFKLLTKGKEVPKDVNFFLLWMPADSSQKGLVKKINRVFPNIPVQKLLTCEIFLALPPSHFQEINSNIKKEPIFNIHTINGKIIPIGPITKLLQGLDIFHSGNRNQIRYSGSVKTWAFLTKLLFELLNKGQFIPILEPSEIKEQFLGQWKIILKSEVDKVRFQTIVNNSSFLAYNIPAKIISQNGSKITEGIWHPSFIFSLFLDLIGDYLIRSLLKQAKFSTFKEFYSSEIKTHAQEYQRSGWDYRFLHSLLEENSTFPITEYYETILPGLIENWSTSARGFSFGHGVLFTFELKNPLGQGGDWPLEFSISPHSKDESILLNDYWKMDSKKQKSVLFEANSENSPIEMILRALSSAAKIFSPIKRALQEKYPSGINLTATEVMDFLRFPKDLMIQNGFNVILPKTFTSGGSQRLSARLVIKSRKEQQTKKGSSSSIPSVFNFKSMIEYKWEATLGGERISEKEFQNLINSNEPLVNIKGNWILVDSKDIENLRELSYSGEKTYIEALKLGLAGEIQLQENGPTYEVIVEGDLSDIVQKLQSIESIRDIPCPSGFNGKLRPYQEIALSWMGNLSPLNFGLCLADDMGLGKTIQVIAFLLHRKEVLKKNAKSVLIVCPTSVLFNWNREIKRFAPQLNITVHHGSDRTKDISDIKNYIKPHEIVLTTYGTVRNDIGILGAIPFDGIIIDESQNIKNYSSQQTQAILKLQSDFRIALSGTPVENRLLELWTLFEFLNPGLLGSRTEFQNNYILPIERFQDQDALERLKTIISPFILRRLKSDKTIINDLPDKNEIKIFIELSDVQAQIYRETVESVFKELDALGADKRKKKGIILALLVKLKQICNHPFQFTKQKILLDNDLAVKDFISRSRKVKRMTQMIEEVIENGEKALLFTQFKEMGSLLKSLLEKLFDFEILFFHGSVPEQKRRELVDKFQSQDIESPPIMILSLKAGGTGLNLTQGTTIFHFDRWWNPAVEEQATDRAYRIGQKSRVNVYKFVTVGTIEEKIDSLLEEKKELAESVITSSGESWISDLSDDKLRELLSLTN